MRLGADPSESSIDVQKKNLQSFVRLYEFLSQIIDYDDHELEQLCVYAKHLYPLLRRDRLDQEKIDVSELSLTHYRLTKRKEQQLRLAEQHGDYELKPGSDIGTGQAHAPEKKKLSEIIQSLNELFGAEINDDDQVTFLNAIAQRISRQDDVMAQVKNLLYGTGNARSLAQTSGGYRTRCHDRS